MKNVRPYLYLVVRVVRWLGIPILKLISAGLTYLKWSGFGMSGQVVRKWLGFLNIKSSYIYEVVRKWL